MYDFKMKIYLKPYYRLNGKEYFGDNIDISRDKNEFDKNLNVGFNSILFKIGNELGTEGISREQLLNIKTELLDNWEKHCLVQSFEHDDKQINDSLMNVIKDRISALGITFNEIEDTKIKYDIDVSNEFERPYTVLIEILENGNFVSISSFPTGVISKHKNKLMHDEKVKNALHKKFSEYDIEMRMGSIKYHDDKGLFFYNSVFSVQDNKLSKKQVDTYLYEANRIRQIAYYIDEAINKVDTDIEWFDAWAERDSMTNDMWLQCIYKLTS